jgi:hypothetical protein
MLHRSRLHRAVGVAGGAVGAGHAAPFTTVGIQSLLDPVVPNPSGGAAGKGGAVLDHLAMDGTGFIGGAMRLLKIENSTGRERDIARVVAQQAMSAVRKFGPRKSVAVFMDGAEPLWRVAKYRTQQQASKRSETRMQKAPSGPLVTAVEEALLEQMLDDGRDLLPPEVVFSSSCEFGWAECKMGAWSRCHLAAAQRLKLSSSSSGYSAYRKAGNDDGAAADGGGDDGDGDTLDAGGSGGAGGVGFLGSTDSYYLVAAVPHRHATSITQVNADFKGMAAHKFREWLGVDASYAPTPNALLDAGIPAPLPPIAVDFTEQVQFSAEVTFLMVLAAGHSPSDFPAVAGVALKDALAAYMRRRIARVLLANGVDVEVAARPLGGKPLRATELLLAEDGVDVVENPVTESGAGAADTDAAIIPAVNDDAAPGAAPATLPQFAGIDLECLAEILEEAAQATKWAAVGPAYDPAVDAYLRLALETALMLSTGVIRDPLYTRTEMRWSVPGKRVGKEADDSVAPRAAAGSP